MATPIFSQDLSILNFNFNYVLCAGKIKSGTDPSGHLFVEVKKFDLKEAFLDFIGLGKNDPPNSWVV